MSKRILLVVTTFNSLTQRVYCRLKDAGHCVSVEYARGDSIIEEAVSLFKPDIIISPYLMQKIPESVWKKIPVIILHPGPLGDRGPSSLDWAVMKRYRTWGVTALQANDEMDAGDIWTSMDFIMRKDSKSSCYRQEVSILSLRMVDDIMCKIDDPLFVPVRQKDLQNINWHIHRPMKQSNRTIDWQNDTTEDIICKIHASDSHPGVKDEILGLKCYMYGVHKESSLKGEPKEILAKRDGAICIGTIDGAVWISHLKEPERFKLPATYVLKDRLKGVKEIRIPLYVDPHLETFKEITFFIRGNVGYLGFDFYNGAMSSQQCIRLKYAIETLKDKVEIFVLTGGKNFFSNGIHLTILEDSAKQGEDGWSNINAMNNLIRSIIFCDDIVTVASFGANAGAGGVFLGLACDFCIAKEGIVLNPHYKTLGLSGSEYHTYTMPMRIGKKMSEKILGDALPLSAKKACEIEMIDKVLQHDDYDESLHSWCQKLVDDEDRYDDILDAKRERLEKDELFIDKCKEDELTKMYPQFWDTKSDFHILRHDFVYKICPAKTPERLAIHRKEENA